MYEMQVKGYSKQWNTSIITSIKTAFLKKAYWLISKTEWQKEGEICYLLVHSPNFAKARTGRSPSQKPRISSRSPLWEATIKSGVATCQKWTNTLIQNAGIPRGSWTCYTKIPTPETLLCSVYCLLDTLTLRSRYTKIKMIHFLYLRNL